MTEERHPYLEGGEDLRVSDDKEEHRKEIEYNEKEDRAKVHDLRWEVYMKEKKELIKREILVAVPYMKGWGGCLDLCGR